MVDTKKEVRNMYAYLFVSIGLLFLGMSFVQAGGTEICDGNDNDHDGLVDEGSILFELDLADAPEGPSITGLGWTDQCKESCSPYCSKTTTDWHDGEVQSGYYFDSPVAGKVIAELTLRTHGFSDEAYRPHQDNEVVEATINGVVFDRTEDNCNDLSCQCEIEEQTSSRMLTLQKQDNHITVREVDDSIGMKSATATFYRYVCDEEEVKIEITSPEEGETFSETQNLSIKVKVENKHRISDLVYHLFSEETGYESGTLSDLVFNTDANRFITYFSFLAQDLTTGGEHTLVVQGIDAATNETAKDTVTFCLDFEPPTKPSNFGFSLDKKTHHNNVSLTWNASHDEPACGTFSHYELFRNNVSITSTTNTQFVDTDLDEGTYAYTVVALDSFNHTSEHATLTVEIEKKKTSSGGGGSGRKQVFTCGEWSVCIDGMKERECVDVDTDQVKTETADCFEEFIAFNTSEERTAPSVVLGASKEPSYWWLWLLLLVVLILAIFAVIYAVKQ